MPEALNEPWEPMPTQLGRRIRFGLTLFVLTLLLLFVQLPLVWMIVTALKKPGTAFKLQFLPETAEVSQPIEPLSPLAAGASRVVFEYTDPKPTSVSVAGDFNGWNKDDPATQMKLTVGGVWVAVIDGASAGPIGYKFVVNGSEWKVDPGNEVTDADGNSKLVVEVGKTVSNRPITNETALSDDGVVVSLRLDPGQTLVARTEDGKEAKLAEKGGVYTATIQGAKSATIRVATIRSFGDAVSALYTISNFDSILNNPSFPFWRYGLNSLVVAFFAAFLTVLVCTMAGYAFAVKEFHFREAIFAFLLSSMLVPGMIYMVPQFSITLKLGWLNSFQGLIVPHLGNVFGLFLLRQYVSQVPRDLFNAAAIDGASELRVFQNIVIPLCMPIMVTLFLLVFVTQWSNFLWQLIVTTPESGATTLPVGLQQFKGQYGTDWELIMAGACFSILPIAILFICAQKFFLEGLTAGAVKE